MTVDITGLCTDHSFESAEEVCRRCAMEFCELCLVYPFGAKKPLCKECAMAEGGVRSHTQRVALGRRDVRVKVKAFRAFMAARSAPVAAQLEDALVLPDPPAPHHEEPDQGPAVVPSTHDHGAPLVEPLPAPAPTAVTAPTGPPTPGDAPAGGVAPPIDWSQPFG